MNAARAWIFKLLILTGVTLLLLVVLARIGWLVDERQDRQREAVAGVQQSQAGEQVLLGPLLLRQCTESWETVSGEGKDRKVEAQKREFMLTVLPTQLRVGGALNSSMRYRGLFKVNGYLGRVQLDAQWASLEGLEPRAEQSNSHLKCEEPQVMVASSDPRGLRAAEIRASQAAPLSVQPGTRHPAYTRGLHAQLGVWSLKESLQLQVTLELDGTQSFALVPAAKATQLDLRSDWPHPSFGGRFLPSARTVTEDGFTAQWKVSELASTAGADVLAGQGIAGLGGSGKADVDSLQVAFIDPVNPYVLSDRAIKYGLMFIGLTFVCVGLVELLAGRRVHPVQYLLVGLAQALFFLLLLSLSEHLNFGLSYLLAAGAAAALLGYYGEAMLGTWWRGLGFGAGIAALYAALYVVLSQEQAALVIGALLLFAVLAAVMVLTRRLDWYALGK